MSRLVHSPGFWVTTCWVPPLALGSGQLLRLYLPNFSPTTNAPLGRALGRQVAAVLNRAGPPWVEKAPGPIPYAAAVSRSWLAELLRPLTAKRLLIDKLRVPPPTAAAILAELAVSGRQRVKSLPLVWQKALVIKGLFATHPVIFFDYYGIGAQSIQLLEWVVDQEIRRGKAAIGFDNVEFLAPAEPSANIQRVLLTEAGPA